MTNEFGLRHSEVTPSRVMHELRGHGWTLKSCGACLGLLGGIVAPLFGSALTAFSWLFGDWHGLHEQRVGTVLLFLTIPLLIFGAHCLDLIDGDDKEGEPNDLERD